MVKLTRKSFGDLLVPVPARWQDASVLTFHQKPGDGVTRTITITREAVEVGLPLEKYVDVQVDQLGSELSQFKLVKRARTQLAEQEGERVETRWKNFDDSMIGQVHHFIPSAGEVVIVTGTGGENAMLQVGALTDQVAAGLRVKPK